MKEDGDTRRVEADLATFQEREDAVGTEYWRALEEKYLRDIGIRGRQNASGRRRRKTALAVPAQASDPSPGRRGE